LRREFEAMRFPGPAASATVSVGVAMASDACRNLPTLLATADRALYRAKADGRNRVAPARPILVDTRGHETARQSVKIDKPAAIVAPVAG
jgi:predicted signal transduction protein with EAL and GGDEF domain